jgi:hypothetical protein
LAKHRSAIFQYNATWLYNDIALAKVDAPFVFSQSASIACLPDAQGSI